jgi:glycosyltransferase involved in cell wall biosynthesis
MCEEFANLGLDVELVIPTRKNIINEDLFSYYNIQNNFKITQVKVFDFVGHEQLFFKKGLYFQALVFFIKLFFKKVYHKDTLVYTRNAEIAWLFKLKGFKVVFEAHYWPSHKNLIYKFFLKNVDLIVCNSRGTEEMHVKNNFRSTIVAHNGVDLEQFVVTNSADKFKRENGFLEDKQIVMYVGHLYAWKGVDTVLKAAMLLQDNKKIKFVFIGGTDEDIEKYNKQGVPDNVQFCGRKRRMEIPVFLRSADVLLLPNIPISEESCRYTSPIKMFEYMASKRPIVASDLPSIREVLNEKNSELVEPGNPQAMADSISKLLNDKNLYNSMAEQAFIEVQKYTWKNRAKKILESISYGI